MNLRRILVIVAAAVAGIGSAITLAVTSASAMPTRTVTVLPGAQCVTEPCPQGVVVTVPFPKG